MKAKPDILAMQLIPAFKKDSDLVAEMDSAPPGDQHFYLWWLGQSGFLLQWNGTRLLLDPYLSDSLTKKYQETDRPHIRMSERVVAPALLHNIAVITCSHNHTDHLDAETLLPVIAGNDGVTLIIPEANRQFVADRLHCDPAFPVGLNEGRQVKVKGFVIQGIPAKHNEIERDEAGNCRFMGYVVQFGRFSIFHSGDTLWFDELVDLVKPFSVDVALLPINGNDPARKVAGNLHCREAAALGKAIGAKTVIPCHYDMFTFNTANVKDFVREAAGIGQAYCVLRGGEYFKGGGRP